MLRQTHFLRLRDGGGAVGSADAGVRGGRGLPPLMGMSVMGVVSVVGARTGVCTVRGRAAASQLRVTAAALLPLPVFQQRHLRQQMEGGRGRQYVSAKTPLPLTHSLTLGAMAKHMHHTGVLKTASSPRKRPLHQRTHVLTRLRRMHRYTDR